MPSKPSTAGNGRDPRRPTHCRFCLLHLSSRHACHKKLHDDEGYHCPFCRHGFTKRDNLRRHLLVTTCNQGEPGLQQQHSHGHRSTRLRSYLDDDSATGSDNVSESEMRTDTDMEDNDDEEVVDVISLGSDMESLHHEMRQANEEEVLNMWLNPSTATISTELKDRLNGTTPETFKNNGERDTMAVEIRKPFDDTNHSPTRHGATIGENVNQGTSERAVVPNLDLSAYSETFLELCVRAYIRNFHPMFPFLHITTVRSSKALHAVIAAVGSLSFDSSQIRAQGRQFFKLVYNSVRSQIEEILDKAADGNLALFQAAVLLQCSVIIFGVGVKVDEACELHGLIATYAQQFGYFTTTHPRISEQFKSHAERRLRWGSWCKIEETIRAVLMLYVLDAQLFIAQRSKTALNHEPSKLPQASPDALFVVDTAEAWSAQHQRKEPLEASCLEAYARLEGIRAAVYEARISNTLSTQRIKRLEYRLCQSIIRSLLQREHSQSDVLGLKLVWHMSFILLSTDPKSLSTTLSGKPSEIDVDNETYVKEWSTSAAGRRSVLHAINIKRIVTAWPVTQKRPSHFPHAACLAGLCICCFIKFGSFEIADLTRSTLGQFNYPELTIDDTDIASALLELNLAAPGGRPAPVAYNMCFQELLFVLESDKHSHMSLGFAKRLQSAIDQGPAEKLPDTLLNLPANSDVFLPQHGHQQGYLESTKLNGKDADVAMAKRKRSARTESRKRKRSQFDDHQTDYDDLRGIESLHAREVNEKRSRSDKLVSSRDKIRSGFHPDFPSCSRCFEKKLHCQKHWGNKACDYCLELGLKICGKILRPFASDSLSKNTNLTARTPTADPPCRRCVQRGCRCARTHGVGAPCDNCCKENRYCFAELEGVVVAKHDRGGGHSSRFDYLSSEGGLPSDHTNHDRNDKDSQSILEDGENDADSDTIMVMHGRGSGNRRNTNQAEARPCRRCFYDGLKCYKPNGLNGKCTKCSSVGRGCHSDLTGIKPYAKRKKSAPRQSHLHFDQFESERSNDGGTDEADDADAEDDRDKTTQTGKGSYGGRDNSDRPINITKQHRAGQFPTDLTKSVSGSSTDPLVVWSAWLPFGTPHGKCAPETRPCRRCFYEGHYCYRSQGPDKPCDTCSRYNACKSDLTGVIPYKYKKAKQREMQGLLSQKQKLDLELRDPMVEPGVAQSRAAPSHVEEPSDLEIDVGVSTDPMVVYQKWLPRESKFRDGKIREARPCRACFASSMNCYKTRNSEKCNRCLKEQRRCRSDLDGAVPSKYLGFKNQVSKLNEGTVSAHDAVDSSSGLNIGESTDPLVIYRRWLPGPSTRNETRARETRPCRSCFTYSINCYKTQDSGRCDRCLKTHQRCRSDLEGAVPYKYLESGYEPSKLSGDQDPSYHALDIASGSDSEVDASTDPMVIYQNWLPKKPPIHGRVAAARPCRRCFVDTRWCTMSMDSEKCDRCFAISVACKASLEGAVPTKYLQFQRKQQAQLQQYDMEGSIEVTTKMNQPADYLSISSGSDEEPMEHVVAERDWSSGTEEEYDEQDIGLKVLALYQRNPPRAQDGGMGEHIPCRRCLLERLCCQRANGPNSACKLCQGRIDAGREISCSSNLRGVVPYKSKYGAYAVPGYQSQEKAPRTYSKATESQQGIAMPARHEKAAAVRRRVVESETDTSSSETEVSKSLESNESILARLFDGNAENTGWKLLQIYLSQPRTLRVNGRPERIPCRYCLRKGLNCVRLRGPKRNCKSCHGLCSHDLRGALAFIHNTYKDLAPPELVGNTSNTSRYGEAPRLREISNHDYNSEEREMDLGDNYLDLEESDDDEGEEEQDEPNLDLDADTNMYESPILTNEDILSSMFDDDPSDIGYQSLLWYLDRPRKNLHDQARKIPCRRCLRANLRCHPHDGPDGKCRECDAPSVRAFCVADLRGAVLYNGIVKT